MLAGSEWLLLETLGGRGSGADLAQQHRLDVEIGETCPAGS